jgi:TolB protein
MSKEVTEKLKQKLFKNMRKLLFLFPVLCLVLCDCGSKKITQQKLGNIEGKVFLIGTGLPIPDVLVSCSGISDTTDSSGAYSLLNIPVGMRSVTAEKEGYELWKAFIDVRKGNNTLDIYMNSTTPITKGIVFYSQRTGSTQLFVMGSDGSNQQQLTSLLIRGWPGDRDPLWSPDKEKIAFIASLKKESWDLMLINSDGTKLDTLVDWRPALLGDWSPDGNWIIYLTEAEYWLPPPLDIFIIKPDGSGDKELIPGEEPRFCGKYKVIYSVDENIYIVNTDGTGQQRLGDSVISGQKAYYYYKPVGSHDGQKIAFGVDLGFNCPHYAVGVMNSDGSEDTLLAFEIGRFGLSKIEFSPDNQKILFLTSDGDNSEIFVINIDGSGLDSLTGGVACADGGASWSPDGNWIAFTSNKNGNKDIFKVYIDSKMLVQLTYDVADDFRPDW